MLSAKNPKAVFCGNEKIEFSGLIHEKPPIRLLPFTEYTSSKLLNSGLDNWSKISFPSKLKKQRQTPDTNRGSPYTAVSSRFENKKFSNPYKTLDTRTGLQKVVFVDLDNSWLAGPESSGNTKYLVIL